MQHEDLVPNNHTLRSHSSCRDLLLLHGKRNSGSPTCSVRTIHESNTHSSQLFPNWVWLLIIFAQSCTHPFFNLLQYLIFGQLCTFQCLFHQLLQYLQYKRIDAIENGMTTLHRNKNVLHDIPWITLFLGATEMHVKWKHLNPPRVIHPWHPWTSWIKAFQSS